MARKFYAIYDIESTTRERVVIRDLDGPRSVTNDAEAVVAELWDRGMLWGDAGDKRIFYYDTNGDLSELCCIGPTFTGFAPINQADSQWIRKVEVTA